jgi:hypothetical protein
MTNRLELWIVEHAPFVIGRPFEVIRAYEKIADGDSTSPAKAQAGVVGVDKAYGSNHRRIRPCGFQRERARLAIGTGRDTMCGSRSVGEGDVNSAARISGLRGSARTKVAGALPRGDCDARPRVDQ